MSTVEGLLLDMDGVLTVSWDPIPGAAEAVGRLRGAGLPLRIITSTTSRTGAEMAANLRRLGIPVEDDEVLTAAMSARDHLLAAHPGARVFVLGDARREDLEGLRLVGLHEDPEVILVSGADESFAFGTFNRVHRALLGGAHLVAMHRNLSWMTHEGECLDAGAYLLGLEAASGREAVVTGKPAAEAFRAGLSALDLPADLVAMVGDAVESDVLAAQRLGITGVLVRTGKFREGALAAAPGRPDHVIDSIADLPALLGV
jgi:HAD superfamily hydrolase (TIGR01458 family)